MEKIYTTDNFTRIFFRFLKNNNAFSNFQHGLSTSSEGRALYDTFYALRFDKHGKKETLANDPIGWILAHEDSSKIFYYQLINHHIEWSHTKEGHAYWKNIHNKWNTFLDKCNIAKKNVSVPIKDISYKPTEEDIIIKSMHDYNIEFEKTTSTIFLILSTSCLIAHLCCKLLIAS